MCESGESCVPTSRVERVFMSDVHVASCMDGSAIWMVSWWVSVFVRRSYYDVYIPERDSTRACHVHVHGVSCVVYCFFSACISSALPA